MNHSSLNRREFVKTTFAATMAFASGIYPFTNPTVVSIVKIKNGNIKNAVNSALELIGGVSDILNGKKKIMLKPNLVSPDPKSTTNPEVVKALAEIFKEAGKVVSIGEGSAAADGFNFKNGVQYRTRKEEILNPMQKFVFDQLGYTKLAEELQIPLINLHSGKLVDVPVKNGLMFEKITLHKDVAETDLLCSVPIMKTHVLATVTLGMKNLIGVYPGTKYYSVRSFLHDEASKSGSPGIAYEIIDMVRASKMGLTVIDASNAMEGNGPSEGEQVKMDLIIAGTNPLATDMVASKVMGFEINEIPTFEWAIKNGMKPARIDEIEIRGEPIAAVHRKFKKPDNIPWNSITHLWGNQEI